MTKICEKEDIKQLIQQIPETHASLTRWLNHLARKYQFERMKQLVLGSTALEQSSF